MKNSFLLIVFSLMTLELSVAQNDGDLSSRLPNLELRGIAAYCPPSIQPLLGEMNKLGVSCFENRQSISLGAEASDQMEAWRQDAQTCQCLQNSPHRAIQSITENKEKIEQIPEVAEQLFVSRTAAELNLRALRVSARQQRLMLQASLLASDEKAAAANLQLYQESLDQVASRRMGSFLRAKSNSRQHLGTDGRKRLEQASSSGIKTGLQEPRPEIFSDNSTNWQHDKQCVGARDFQSFNQLPTNPHFFAGFSKLTSYHDNDWDMTRLKAKFKKSANEKETFELQQRIAFLSKNPLIKQLFSSNAPKEKKAELFKILKVLEPQTSCQSSNNPRQCLEDFSQKKITGAERAETLALVKYKKDLQDYFIRNDIREIISKQSKAEVEKIFDAKQTPRLPKNRIYLDNLSQQLGGNSIQQCNGDKTKIADCAKAFSYYCSLINETANQPNDIDSVEEEQEIIDMANLEPDMEKNPALKDFNTTICHSRRKTTNPQLPAVADFFTFRKEFCRKNDQAAGCGQATQGDPSLVKTYLENYPVAESINSADEQSRNSYVQAFKQFLQHTPSAKPSVADVASRLAGGPLNESQKRELSYQLVSAVRSNAAINTPVSTPAVTSGPGANRSGSETTTAANAATLGSTPAPIPNTFINPVTPTEIFKNDINEIQNLQKENKTAREQLAREIASTRTQLGNTNTNTNTNPNDTSMQNMEQRLQGLERKLAEKEQESESLRQALKREQTADNSSTQGPRAVGNNSVAPASSRANFEQAANHQSADFPDQVNRAPASITGSLNQSASAIRAETGKSSFNAALLEAHLGVKVPPGAAPEGIMIASENGPVPALLLETLQNSPVQRFAASEEDYRILASKDHKDFNKVLKKYADQINFTGAPAVPIIISNGPNRQLSMNLIQSGDRYVLYRNNTLSTLNQLLQQ